MNTKDPIHVRRKSFWLDTLRQGGIVKPMDKVHTTPFLENQGYVNSRKLDAQGNEVWVRK